MKKLLGPLAIVLLVAGCGTTSTGAVTQAHSASPAAASSPTPPASPTPDYSALWPRSTQIAYDSTHKNVVLFGGNLDRTGVGNDTWIWSGGRWTQQHPATNPPARAGAVLVDEPEMHGVLLFGGAALGVNPRDDTWAWNGINWIQLLPAHSPSPRDGAAATWDPVRHVVLLFGGGDAETWTWNGQDWSQATPAQSPPSRAFARLAVDEAHGEAVLFGGYGGRDDTWTWDGTTWTEQHPTNTPPAIDEVNPMVAQLAYDSIRKVVVIAAPNDKTNKTETFTWSADGWTPVSTADSPVARDGAGLAFDEADGITIFAGGLQMGAGDVTRTWGFDGTNWKALD